METVHRILLYLACCELSFHLASTQDNACPAEANLYPELQDDQCLLGSTCPFQTNNTWLETSSLENTGIIMRHCMCDKFCVTYGDCCKDVYDQIEDGITPPWEGNHKDLPVLPEGTFECTINSLFLKDQFVYVVNSCPSNWKYPEVQDKCESFNGDPSDTFQTWPVSDTHGILYKNIYCARCHNVQEHHFWKMEVECKDMIDKSSVKSTEELQNLINEWLGKGICRRSFQSPNTGRTFRPCKEVIKTCAEDWAEDKCNIKKKCEEGFHNYVYGLLDSTPRYKNKYCAKCNHNSEVTCTDQAGFAGVGVSQFFYPLSIIFDVNPGSGGISVGHGDSSLVNDTVSDMKACGNDEVYDPFQGMCRRLSCQTGYVLEAGNCIKKSSSYSGSSGHIDCIRISLNHSEFVIGDNGDLQIVESSIFHPEGTYDLLDDGSALVCTNFTQNYTETRVILKEDINLKFSNVQTILTVVGLIISLVGLFIQLVVYSLFAKLRNLAGRNLMCLSAALFCGQLFFLVGSSASENYIACALLSILTHSGFLAAFAWMNIMAFDIWKTFANTSKAATLNHQGRKFLRYCIFGWGAPLLLILIAIVVNFTTTDTYFRPGYGETICWIRYRPALLLFFAAPVALVVIVNLVFYILTIVSIYKISKLAKSITNKSDKTRLWLYIKLSSIMGLTWIFGFVAAIFDSHVLWYFFIIFNSLQGAFICASFVFTKQVYNLMRDRFQPVYMALSTTQSTTASTSVSETHPSRLSMSGGVRGSHHEGHRQDRTSKA